MVKKILFAGAITSLILGNIAMANPAPYIGGSIGIITNTSSIKVNNRATPTVFGGSYRGVPFNVFAGFGGEVNQNFYFAGEIFGTLGTANISDNQGLKTSYSYGAAIIPGVMLSDHTLAYVRAGILRTRFTQANETRTGGQAGVGLQTTLTQNIDLRGEYDYNIYRSVNSTIAPGTKVSVTPVADQFTLGLVYKFD